MSGVLRTVGRVAGVVAVVATVLGHPEVALIAQAASPPSIIGAALAPPPISFGEVIMSKVLRTAGAVAGVVSVVAFAALTAGVGGAAAAPLLGQIAGIASVASAPSTIGTELPAKPVTAINIFHDTRRAYLATDGAAFHPITGRVEQLRPKVAAWPNVSVAIAIAGNGTPEHLLSAMEQANPAPTQNGLLKALPDALRIMNRQVQSDIETEWSDLAGTQRLYVASYDRLRAKPRLFAVATHPDPTAPEAAPYVLRELRAGFTSGLTSEEAAAAIPAGYITDPKADAISLLSRQRLSRSYDGGFHAVGGVCELVTVSRRGVEVQPVLRFPEQPGEMIDPDRPGVLV